MRVPGRYRFALYPCTYLSVNFDTKTQRSGTACFPGGNQRIREGAAAFNINSALDLTHHAFFEAGQVKLDQT
jgi:hypothetical protein